MIYFSNFKQNFMSNINIEKKLKAIEQRNKKVELDKAWESSISRKIIIAILTYITIVLFFTVAKLPKPFINSIVPTTGFLLSTLSLPFFKRIWIRCSRKKWLKFNNFDILFHFM